MDETPFEQQIREQAEQHATLGVDQSVAPPMPGPGMPELAPQEPQAPAKILGMFDNEQQLGAVVETLVKEREQYASEVAKLRAMIEEQQPRQVDPAIHERRAFVDRQNYLTQKAVEARQAGRVDEAADLTAQIIYEASKYKGGDPETIIQKRVEEELNRRLGPIASMKQFEQAPNIQHLRDFAPDAVKLQMAGLPEDEILDLLNRAYSAGYQSMNQKLAEQRGYTEPVEVWNSPKDRQEFDNNSRRAWEKIVGTNQQKFQI